jgi:exosortase
MAYANTSPVGAIADPASADPIAPPTGFSWRRISIYLLAGELLLLYAPTMRWLFERWTLSVWHHAHGLFIPPIVGYFVYRELARVKHLPRSASPWGFVVLAPALLLVAVDAAMHTQLLSAIALVLTLPALALLLLGTQRTRAILFPLSLSISALPIPLALTEQIHWQLRLIVTAASRFTLPLIGIPVFAEGTTLHLPPGNLEIADACSGFSTIYAAVAVAFLTAYSTPNVKRRVLVMLSAVPLAIGANILRVVALSAFVVWQGPWILDSVLHPVSGMMTFAIALPLIFWIGGNERHPSTASSPGTPDHSTSGLTPQ